MPADEFHNLVHQQVLYLTTKGRITGLPREIEIWFILRRGKFYLFAEHGERARWVRNIRRDPNVSVRIGRCQIKAAARVLAHDTDRTLWDEVQAAAQRKYGWGDGLPVEIAPVPRLRAIVGVSEEE